MNQYLHHFCQKSDLNFIPFCGIITIYYTKEGEINVSELANIASCPEFKELISLSYPALGFTYDELLEELEDNPISFEKFKNNINKIVNSFYQYGKNIYLWQ